MHAFHRPSVQCVICLCALSADVCVYQVWSLESNAPKEAAPAEVEPQERKVSYKTVVITEVCDDLSFYAQNVDTGPQLEKLMEWLRLMAAQIPDADGLTAAQRDEQQAQANAEVLRV